MDTSQWSRNARWLLEVPDIPCGSTEQQCPLMRMCPCCGFSFVTARNRRQHENYCREVLDQQVADAQHRHLIHAHRIRRRGGRTRG